MRKLELLSPAANKDVAREAILHGADAVYIGASSHGARKGAANSIEDIAEVVRFAHQFRARVYVTVNTVIYEKELADVEALIWKLYRIGVDAIIVQDMSILRMNLPPIELHASTQCDTRTVDKALFLEKVGFSQIVLARELSIDEISSICQQVSVPVECFVHGALCVSYSGRCQASQVSMGRSANRGECSQMCRLPYTLTDRDGHILQKNRYLLSLRDFNTIEQLPELVDAGVRSFKIEGRLKDVAYVKNVTAAYRQALDRIIAAEPDKYCRSSYGDSTITFEPNLNKSFNRGFTNYFLSGRRDVSMASILTPKHIGERIDDVRKVNNGDGISFFNSKSEYEGVRINSVENGRLVGAKPFQLPKWAEIYRTYDRVWQTEIERNTATRKLKLDIVIDEVGLTAVDERCVRVRIPLGVEKDVAKQEFHPERILGKLGSTIFELRNFENRLEATTFIPASGLSDVKRRMLSALEDANNATYPFGYRRSEDRGVPYVSKKLMSTDNVTNSFSEAFYREHGVEEMRCGVEVEKRADVNQPGKEVMHTRYCLRRELGLCKKRVSRVKGENEEPWYITSGKHRFRLQFDCANCEMKVITT